MDPKHLVPGDPLLIENIVSYLKAKGIFDEFRHECLADVDTKSSCQNLSQRVDGYAAKFLSSETWHPELNKNEMRNKLRRHIDESGMLAVGADHVVEQVINPKIAQLFLPKIIEVVHQFLNEENEKLKEKQESVSQRIKDNTVEKPKNVVIDPVADILSFSYTKPKQKISVPSMNVSAKQLDGKTEKKKDDLLKTTDNVLKVEKKKEEQLPKCTDSVLKVEKKKEDQYLKSYDIVPKVEKKKEEILPKSTDFVPKLEKKKEEVPSPVITPDIISDPKNLKDEVLSEANFTLTQSSSDKQDVVSVKSEKLSTLVPSIDIQAPSLALKVDDVTDDKNLSKSSLPLENIEETDSSVLDSSKTGNEELKIDLKSEDSKDQNSDSCLNIDEVQSVSTPLTPVKSTPDASKKAFKEDVKSEKNSFKAKSDSDKNIKVKSHSASKPSTSVVDSKKPKIKEHLDHTQKISLEKHPKGSSSLAMTKDRNKSPSLQNKSGSLKSTKPEKLEDKKKKEKSISHVKSVDSSKHKSDSSKSQVGVKKESSSSKVKHSSDKQEKYTSLKRDTKIGSKAHSSVDPEKVSKSSSHYSSSYESSQGSDQDKCSVSSSEPTERQKHFSKHHKKEHSSSSKSSTSVMEKRPQSDSDSGTPKKPKHTKHGMDKHKSSKQELLKISSRSNSCGSVSSTSDSQASTSLSTSEEIGEVTLKSSDKKKSKGKDKEPCSGVYYPPPPPPPPPPPSSSISTGGTYSSSVEDTHSSQESDSASKSTDDDSSSESEAEGSFSSSTLHNVDLTKKLKAPDILNDIYDVFMYSSSSSEFEGYSSSECVPVTERTVANLNVSPVHTSDLSSFDDELSDSELSDAKNDVGNQRLTIKQAQRILQERAEQRRNEARKITTVSRKPFDVKKTCNVYEGSASPIASEEATSPPSEGKRESRRERKLNPKYASSEYASIFNSKRTSFITKQAGQPEDKAASPTKDPKKAEPPNPAPKSLPVPALSQKSPPHHSGSYRSLLPADGNLKMKFVSSSAKKLPEGSPSHPEGGVSKKHPPEEAPPRSEGMVAKKNIFKGSSPRPEGGATKEDASTRVPPPESQCLDRIALKVKKSSAKSDKEANRESLQQQGVKRKHGSGEEPNGPSPAKRPCHHRNSLALNAPSEGVANENKPMNNSSGAVGAVEPARVKDFFLKQKVGNNGDVLNEIEIARKTSLSQSNHVSENQVND